MRAGSPAAAAITYSYDTLGRRLTRTEPNESDPAQPYARTWAYDRRTVTATDTRGHVTWREYDVAGHLGRTVEALGRPEQVVRDYAYGPFGRLKSTQVWGRPETASHYTWDHRGNLLTRTDPDRGLTTYQYNAFNEPILTRDANGRERRPIYDPLGRVDLLRVPEVTPASTKLLSVTDYTYDVEPATQDTEFGRLTQVRREDYVSATADGDEQRTQVDYDYDALGRLAAVTHTVPSDVTPGVTAPYVVRYNYDAFDRVREVHYPTLPGQNAPVRVGYQLRRPARERAAARRRRDRGRRRRTAVDLGEHRRGEPTDGHHDRRRHW